MYLTFWCCDYIILIQNSRGTGHCIWTTKCNVNTVWAHIFMQVHWCMCIACAPTKQITSIYGFMLPRWWVVSGLVYFLGSCLDCDCQLGLVTWSEPAVNVETLQISCCAIWGQYILSQAANFTFYVFIMAVQVPGPSGIDTSSWYLPSWTCIYDLHWLCLHFKEWWVFFGDWIFKHVGHLLLHLPAWDLPYCKVHSHNLVVVR